MSAVLQANWRRGSRWAWGPRRDGRGQQGGAVVRALQADSQFKVRALSRNPGKHRELTDEVVEADLDRPETSKLRLKAHMRSFWSPMFGKRVPTSSSSNRSRKCCQGYRS